MSNQTQFVLVLIKGAMLIACKADVFAPESHWLYWNSQFRKGAPFFTT
jgi:hypothetical protein